MGMSQNRIQAGVPTGGEFATTERAENADLTVPTRHLTEETVREVRTVHDDSTGYTYAVQQRWFVFKDQWGKPHRDPSKGPAEVGYMMAEWSDHGRTHRDPEEGPAVIRSNGSVSYAVDGMPVGVSAETLERHGVKRTPRGLFLKNWTSAKFWELQEGFIAEINQEDPWA